MKKQLYIFLFMIFSVNIYAQIDTEFWFAFPDITSGDYGADNSINLCLISFDQPCNVHISQPAENGLGTSAIDTMVYLPPNSVKTLDWGRYKAQLETNSDLSYPYGMPFGLLITSDNSISAYYANTSNDSEAYIFKGRNALGIDFLVPMQYEYRSGSYAKDAYNSIEILATEDNTDIAIELHQWTTSQLQTSQKQTINIKLNRGWTYSFAAKGSTGAEHLHNTRIKSNKPIAVNSTDDSVEPGDLVGDQLTPVKLDQNRYLAGKEYVAVRNFGNIEKIYVFPTERNTRIWVNNVEQPVLANLGDKMMIDLTEQTSDATYITSDKPITVFQITSKRNSRELGGASIPSIGCTGSTETVYKSAFANAEIVLDLITRTAYTGDFKLNGKAGVINASHFSVVHGNPEYSFARVILSSTDPVIADNGGVIRITNSAGVFHAGALDSPTGNNSCTYGYFSDFRELELNLVADKNVYYDGDDLVLNIMNSEALTNIVWTKPDGTTFSGNPLIVPNVSESDAGVYMVTADSKEGCVMPEAGFIVVDVFNTLKTEHTICSGESKTLISRGEASYSWIGEDGEQFSDMQSVVVSPTKTTIFKVENHLQAQSIATNGNFQLGNKYFESELKYGGTNSTAVSSPGYYSVWKVAREVNGKLNRVYDHTIGNASDGLMLIANLDGSAGRKVWTKTYEVKPNTRYQLSAWFITPTTSGAQANLDFSINDELQGKSIVPPYTKTVSNPSLWKNDSCFWDSGNRTTVTVSIVTNSSTPANVCIDDIAFRPYLPVTDIIKVDVVEAPKPEITGDDIICKGVAVLDAGGFEDGSDFNSYKWYKEGSTTQIGNSRSILVSESGSYVVEVDNLICSRLDTFWVEAGETLQIKVDSRISICPGEPSVALKYISEEGKPLFFDVIYDAGALAAGFSNILNEPVVSDDELLIVMPHNPRSGTYSAELVITGGSECQPIAKIALEVVVKIEPTNYIAQKWNNVLALYNEESNGGTSFVAYQWYKNGSPIEGATRSYLYLGEGNRFDLEDRYAALLTLEDGSTLLTCDFFPEEREDQLSIPSAVKPNQLINLQGVEGEVAFWDISGLLYSSQQLNTQTPSVHAPSKKGWYVLEINTGETQRKYKIVVQ